MTQQRKTQIRIKKKTRELIRLEQEHFYEGLLEGMPTKEMSYRRLAAAVSQERGRTRAEPLLLPPVEIRDDSYEKAFGHPYPLGEPLRFPSIVCVGRFKSLNTARDLDKDCSELSIIWFQDDFAFPIQDDILKQLEAVDWNAHATDYQW